MTEGRKQQKPIAVIGAGVVGAATALMLAREGHAVTLFDPEDAGEQCSFGNASLIASFAVEPLVLPGDLPGLPRQMFDPMSPLFLRWRYLPKAIPWLLGVLANAAPKKAEALARAKASLLARIESTLPVLVAEASASHLVRKPGLLDVYGSERTWKASRALDALRERNGVRVEDISVEEARQMEPALAPVFSHARFVPDVWQTTNPHALTQAIVAAFRAHGGEVVRDRVRDFVRDGQRVTGMTGEAGRYDVAGAVVAAGAWSKTIATRLGFPLPMEVERGYHIMTHDATVRLDRPLCWVDGPVYMAPLETGLRLTSVVEIAGMDAPRNPKCFEMIRRHAARILPDLDTRATGPDDEWMGLRPSVTDPNPVLGRAPGFANLYFNFGHGHTGLTLAAPSAQVIADLVAGRDPGLDLGPFRADRF